jgi:hypothetical protein
MIKESIRWLLRWFLKNCPIGDSLTDDNESLVYMLSIGNLSIQIQVDSQA